MRASIGLGLLFSLACRPADVAAPEAPTDPIATPGEADESAPATGPTELRFAWESACTVETRTTLSGSEESAEYRQLLAIRPHPERDALVLSGAGVELLRYRGRDPADPAVQHGVARFLVTYSLPVEFVIDRAGKLLDVHGIDAETLLGVARKLRPLTPEAEDMVRILFKRQDIRDYFLYLAQREWSAWGSAWHGLTFTRGEERVVEDTVEIAGKALPRRTTMLHAGPAEARGHVRLMFERIVEATREQVRDGGTLFQFEFGRPPLGERGTLITMQSFEQVELVTDPATLRPLRVSYEWSRRVDGERTWFFKLVKEFTWPARCGAGP
ncbi:hypothetical protein [Nannocystis radixulma]|uniref:Lipoprotein n=1 Tax=Nannocystis radixulma TaxID=2995305 RepID=A0ABT5B0T5_9BACT|nr:hypothetical protein [Nannocystis radixulma]MDC0667714.1 hypothetical protein [Nannocystis radixulma]